MTQPAMKVVLGPASNFDALAPAVKDLADGRVPEFDIHEDAPTSVVFAALQMLAVATAAEPDLSATVIARLETCPALVRMAIRSGLISPQHGHSNVLNS